MSTRSTFWAATFRQTRAWNTAIGALSIAFCGASAAAADLDLKGIGAATTQESFAAQYPKAKCSSSKAPAAGMPQPVQCSVRDFTIAGAATSDARFIFYRGRLGFASITFEQSDYLHVRRALVGKWGAPNRELSRLFSPSVGSPIGGEEVVWTGAATHMRLMEGKPFASPSKLWISTDAEEAWHREADARRNGGKGPDV